MAEPLLSFGAWVRRRRQALALSRDDLAGAVGVAPVTLRKIEADERRPSAEVAALLARQLDLPPDLHTAFVQAARGLLAVDRLPDPVPPHQPLADHPAPLILPSGAVTGAMTIYSTKAEQGAGCIPCRHVGRNRYILRLLTNCRLMEGAVTQRNRWRGYIGFAVSGR